MWKERYCPGNWVIWNETFNIFYLPKFGRLQLIFPAWVPYFLIYCFIYYLLNNLSLFTYYLLSYMPPWILSDPFLSSGFPTA